MGDNTNDLKTSLLFHIYKLIGRYVILLYYICNKNEILVLITRTGDNNYNIIGDTKEERN